MTPSPIAQPAPETPTFNGQGEGPGDLSSAPKPTRSGYQQPALTNYRALSRAARPMSGPRDEESSQPDRRNHAGDDLETSLGRSNWRDRRTAKEEKLQEWEGRIIRVDPETFVARLADLTNNESFETEEGEFPLDDVSPQDLKLVRENALFRWVVGYRYIGATKERFNRVVFRRLPAWSAAELREAKQEALKPANAVIWD